MSANTQDMKYDNVQIFSFARKLRWSAAYEREYFASSLLSYHNVALLGNVVNEAKHFSFSSANQNSTEGALFAVISSPKRGNSCPSRRLAEVDERLSRATRAQENINALHSTNINRTNAKAQWQIVWKFIEQETCSESSPSGPSTSLRTAESLLEINR